MEVSECILFWGMSVFTSGCNWGFLTAELTDFCDCKSLTRFIIAWLDSSSLAAWSGLSPTCPVHEATGKKKKQLAYPVIQG